MFKKVATYLIGIGLVAVSTAVINNHIRSSNNSEALLSVAASMQEMAVSLDQISQQNQALILLSTFRTDPWSGKMMEAYQACWIDWVKEQDPTITMTDFPDIGEIQRRYAADLVPKDFFESFTK